MTAAKTSQKPRKNPGGRPKKQFELKGLEFKEVKRSAVKMSDRKAVETVCERIIDELQNDTAQTKSDMRTILDALKQRIVEDAAAGKTDLSLLRTFEQQQQRFRQACKDQAGLLSMLMKQFELFTALNPTDTEGSHTPVTFNLQAMPPREVVVPNKFTLPADAIDPDRKAG